MKIESEWDEGNFLQTMICNGGVVCRAFVEHQLASGRRYPDFKTRSASYPRKTYAVLFERKITKPRPGDRSDKVEEEYVTKIDEMKVFTTKTLANIKAKEELFKWFESYLKGENDRAYLAMTRQDLWSYEQDINEKDGLFDRVGEMPKYHGRTETMRVWVKELAAKGPSN